MYYKSVYLFVSFDELIVGAPMYRDGTRADAGRIFVYSNTNVRIYKV